MAALDRALERVGENPRIPDYNVFGYVDREYQTMLRRFPESSLNECAEFAVRRCVNLHEQRQRRASHGTGCVA